MLKAAVKSDINTGSKEITRHHLCGDEWKQVGTESMEDALAPLQHSFQPALAFRIPFSGKGSRFFFGFILREIRSLSFNYLQRMVRASENYRDFTTITIMRTESSLTGCY